MRIPSCVFQTVELLTLWDNPLRGLSSWEGQKLTISHPTPGNCGWGCSCRWLWRTLGDSFFQRPLLGWIYLGQNTAENIGAFSALILVHGEGILCSERQAEETWEYSQIALPLTQHSAPKAGVSLRKKSNIAPSYPQPPALVCQRDEERDMWEEPCWGQNKSKNVRTLHHSKDLIWFDICNLWPKGIVENKRI